MPRQKDPFTGEKFRVGTGADAPTPFSGLSKIKPEQWKSMGDAFDKMGEFVMSGGFSAISQAFTGPIDKLKTQLSNSVEDALSPITGLFVEAINDVMSKVSVAVSDFVLDLDSVKVGLIGTAAEATLLEQMMKGVKASFFGLTSFVPGMIFEFQKLADAMFGQRTIGRGIEQLAQDLWDSVNISADPRFDRPQSNTGLEGGLL